MENKNHVCFNSNIVNRQKKNQRTHEGDIVTHRDEE